MLVNILLTVRFMLFKSSATETAFHSYGNFAFLFFFIQQRQQRKINDEQKTQKSHNNQKMIVVFACECVFVYAK